MSYLFCNLNRRLHSKCSLKRVNAVPKRRRTTEQQLETFTGFVPMVAGTSGPVKDGARLKSFVERGLDMHQLLAIGFTVAALSLTQPADRSQRHGPTRECRLAEQQIWPESLTAQHLTRSWRIAPGPVYSGPIMCGPLGLYATLELQ